MSTDIVKAVASKLTLAGINDYLNRKYGKEAPNLETGTAIILSTLETKEHTVAVFWDILLGKGTTEDIQSILDTIDPEGSTKTASHHLCRFRNPDKYRPKYSTHYPVTSGRGGRMNLDIPTTGKMADAISSFFGK